MSPLNNLYMPHNLSRAVIDEPSGAYQHRSHGLIKLDFSSSCVAGVRVLLLLG